ncbi:MAG: CRTAC1 family protein [Planctomycetota bacterium]
MAIFFDITEAAKLDHLHQLTLGEKLLLPEIMGSGLAVFDADQDGDLDLYFLNAGRHRDDGAANQLFLRDKNGHYEEAPGARGLDDLGYGTGVAIGDVDNDGDLDVYVGNWGPDRLYLNDGHGNFKDSGQTFAAEWTTSVAMFDADLDGWLDIYAVHYVHLDERKECTLANGRTDYCSPKVFNGIPDAFYRNQGEGKFKDATVAAGIGAAALNGLGIKVMDVNHDNYPDIFVTNDGEANLLWLNEGGRKFRDAGYRFGVAVNGQGSYEASMGIAWGDVDQDGDFDLLCTHLTNESHTLYLREQAGFEDATGAFGLHVPTLADTGFGTSFLDADGDGDLDLVVANGRVGWAEPHPGTDPKDEWRGYPEPNRLFLNDGKGRFAVSPVRGGDFVKGLAVSRSLAAVDLDADGDCDLVIGNSRSTTRIYDNQGFRGHWLALDLYLGEEKRRALGALVTARSKSRTFIADTSQGGSYQTAVDAPLLMSLGSETSLEALQIRWPNGETESFEIGAVDQLYRIVKGEGISK